jgi:DNA-binding NarL/FixJ family response regulator
VRILVIDDYLNVEMALRGILDGHTVAGVRDPAALPRMLAYEEPFEAAIVDLRYVQSAATGLTALATLRELSPGTKTIISTTDEEENRLLYLLAAFQFFEPRALLAKRADAFVTRAVVEAIGRGDPSPSPDADPFRRAAATRPPLLDQLVHNRTASRSPAPHTCTRGRWMPSPRRKAPPSTWWPLTSPGRAAGPSL